VSVRFGDVLSILNCVVLISLICISRSPQPAPLFIAVIDRVVTAVSRGVLGMSSR